MLGPLSAGVAASGASSASAVTIRDAAPKRLAPIPLPANPRVYFFGDSWTNGATADPGRGFPFVVSEALGWTPELGPDNSGAGYVHTYNPAHILLPDAAHARTRITADLIVLAGGVNDVPGPLTDFSDHAVDTVRTLRAKAGGAPLVMIGPAYPDGTVPAGLRTIDLMEAGVAARLGIHYISPLQERWFNPVNVGALMDPVNVHPNTAGHAYYGGRLAARMQQIITAEPGPAAPKPPAPKKSQPAKPTDKNKKKTKKKAAKKRPTTTG